MCVVNHAHVETEVYIIYWSRVSIHGSKYNPQTCLLSGYGFLLIPIISHNTTPLLWPHVSTAIFSFLIAKQLFKMSVLNNLGQLWEFLCISMREVGAFLTFSSANVWSSTLKHVMPIRRCKIFKGTNINKVKLYLYYHY